MQLQCSQGTCFKWTWLQKKLTAVCKPLPMYYSAELNPMHTANNTTLQQEWQLSGCPEYKKGIGVGVQKTGAHYTVQEQYVQCRTVLMAWTGCTHFGMEKFLSTGCFQVANILPEH